MTLDCLRCSRPYEQGARRATHFCESCRDELKAEQRREYMQHTRSIARDVRHDIDTYRASYEDDAPDIQATIEWLMGAQQDSVFATIADYAETVDEGDAWALTHDAPIPGANSDSGPDEGATASFTDVREWLDWHAHEVGLHRWFLANPHWTYELHNPAKAYDSTKAQLVGS